jgi:hypothetical protein
VSSPTDRHFYSFSGSRTRPSSLPTASYYYGILLPTATTTTTWQQRSNLCYRKPTGPKRKPTRNNTYHPQPRKIPPVGRRQDKKKKEVSSRGNPQLIASCIYTLPLACSRSLPFFFGPPEHRCRNFVPSLDPFGNRVSRRQIPRTHTDIRCIRTPVLIPAIEGIFLVSGSVSWEHRRNTLRKVPGVPCLLSARKVPAKPVPALPSFTQICQIPILVSCPAVRAARNISIRTSVKQSPTLLVLLRQACFFSKPPGYLSEFVPLTY